MPSQMLSQIIQSLPASDIIETSGSLDVQITAPIVESSNDVQQGSIFVARKGLSVDGHAFIDDAIKRGAVAVVGEQTVGTLPVPYIQVRDAQSIIGKLSAAYYGFPSRKLIVIGVTGTDGKTTTSHLIHSILNTATNGKAGFISTIAAELGNQSIETGLHVTTPGAPQVQEYLHIMAEAGMTHCVLEMTSHGLAQGRLNGVDIDIAVLTNVTHEHLDYHGTWEEYRAAKAIMFRMLDTSFRKSNQQKVSILNADDPSFAFFDAILADRVFAYGIEVNSDISADQIVYTPAGTRILVNDQWLESSLIGLFNVYNILAAVSVARSLGIGWDTIRNGIQSVQYISGRMERIDEGQDFLAIVDFAHTPNALRRALEAGRTMVQKDGRLIAVFGSAGLRDVEKRRLMAEVSAQLADITILTAEDPRTESLDEILQMMADGCAKHGGIEGQSYFRVPDRGNAIYIACEMANPDDVVMVCGKGHEQSMCFGTTEYPWDDRDALRSALRGQPLQTLPTATTQ